MMKKWIFLLMAVCSCQFAFAQYNHAQVFGDGITAQNLRKKLYTIAGAPMAGRETATAGQRKAARYLEDYYTQLGVVAGNHGSYLQYFKLFRDTVTLGRITVNGHVFDYGHDFYGDLQNNHSEHIENSEVVFAGYGIVDSSGYNDYRGVDVHGKFVIIRSGEPRRKDGMYPLSGKQLPSHWSRDIRRKLALAAERGAVALLVINEDFPRIQSYRSRLIRSRMYLEDEKKLPLPPINTYFISPDIAKEILGRGWYTRLKDMRARTINRQVNIEFDKAHQALQSSNVLAYLPGTDKGSEMLVISAHYDHLGTHDGKIYYGADDDGSGTVAVMEIAKAFARAAQTGHRPRRSILFLHVSGEEKGLLGSLYYTRHPVYSLENTITDLNIDMIGRVDPLHSTDSNYVYIVGDDKLSSGMRPVSETANSRYTELNLDYKYNDPDDSLRIYYRSDHYNFARHDIPVIFYFDGIHEDYHKPTDTPDKINYRLLAKRTQLVFYTAWELANRDHRPRVDRHLK